MPGTKKNQPAVFVGGQRRKLRRSGTNTSIPRSNTMPVINPESAAASLVSSVSGLGAGISSERLSEGNQSRTQQEDPPPTYYYPPAARAAQFRPPSSPFSSKPVISSPRPVTAGVTMSSDENKKPDPFRDSLKDDERLDTTYPPLPLLPTSPLPPLTPSKAAQFLGLNADPGVTGSPRAGKGQDHDTYEGLVVVRPDLRKQKSMPLLTRLKLGTDKQTKFKEEGIEPDPKSKKVRGGNHKAKRVLNFLPSFGTSKRNQGFGVISPPLAAEDGDVTDSGYRDGHEYRQAAPTGHQVLQVESRGNPSAPTRRRRKKDPKSLERMSPITETSFDDLRAVHKDEEDGTELEVISEYENDPCSPDRQFWSPEWFPQSHATFELDEDDLSPTAELLEDETAEVSPYAMHPGKPVNLRRLGPQQATAVRIRSPLQAVEARLLDVAEGKLAIDAVAANLSRLEAEKLVMDVEVARLKRQHENMRKAFEVCKHLNNERQHEHQHCDHKYGHRHNMLQNQHCNHKHDHKHKKSEHANAAEDSDDSESLVSLRSNIDLDEEPTVHTARVFTITRITPGMVKLIDIPPRRHPDYPPIIFGQHEKSKVVLQDKSILRGKNKVPLISIDQKGKSKVGQQDKNKPPPSIHVSQHEKNKVGQCDENKAPLSITVDQHGKSQRTFYIDGDGEAGSAGERGEHMQPNASRRYSELADSSKPKKAKLPRDESRLLVQNWVTDYNRTTQRPVSERMDVDVLADQQIPPAPFPKTDKASSFTAPMSFSASKRPQKHQCVLNGHAFQSVDLKKIPDEATMNNLQVRPYLQTRNGIKQHVRVPVRCDRCSKDVNDDLSVCEVDVCRMAACRKCTDAMECEWQARAVAEWKHTPRTKT